jgi:outer membrane murein-binding lipoprotein Lpp
MGVDYGPLITATSAILVAIITGTVAIIQARKKLSADAQTGLTTGFQMLITKLQEERVALTGVIEGQAKENVQLKAEVSTLNTTVRRLERKLDAVLRRWRAGEDPPSEDEEHLEHGGNR